MKSGNAVEALEAAECRQNRCSGKGHCVKIDGVTTCKCSEGYSGASCQDTAPKGMKGPIIYGAAGLCGIVVIAVIAVVLKMNATSRFLRLFWIWSVHIRSVCATNLMVSLWIQRKTGCNSGNQHVWTGEKSGNHNCCTECPGNFREARGGIMNMESVYSCFSWSNFLFSLAGTSIVYGLIHNFFFLNKEIAFSVGLRCLQYLNHFVQKKTVKIV